MDSFQKLLYKNKDYIILDIEHNYMIHPMVLGIMPVQSSSIDVGFRADYSLKEYQLYLDSLAFLDCSPIPIEDKPIFFTGTILIGRDLIAEYPSGKFKPRKLFGPRYHSLNSSLPVFSYRYVYELVFRDGLLETSVEHTRSMHRIRMNLDMGKRNLMIKKDVRCIESFLGDIFIGKYKNKSSNKQMKYLKELKEVYQSYEKSVSFSSIN